MDLLYQILGRLNSRILRVFVDLRHQWKDKAAPDPAERHDQDHSRNHIRCWKVCYFVHTETGCQHEKSTHSFEIIDHCRGCQRVDDTGQKKFVSLYVPRIHLKN